MKNIFARLAFAAFVCLLPHQEMTAQNRFVVMELNCENLFDTKHDSLKNDNEFLPGAIRGWSPRRYWKKLAHTAQTIVAVGEGQTPPDIVALCEVENDSVLYDLTRRSPLRNLGYKYCVTESPDARGIDVALLYQPETFKLIQSEFFRIEQKAGQRPTRDILHVSGCVMGGDTLDVMVAHLPSMLGGRLKSEPFRVHVAEKIRQTADSIQSVRHKPKIIIIGDFNDYPDSKPVAEVVGAVRPPAQNDSIKANSYYNLMNGKQKKNGNTIGTYRYKGYWNIIDQCIVNGLLLTDTENLCTTYEDAQICDFEFLLEPDLKFGGMKPFRTYNGMKYREGYSDHLPIRIVFRDSFSR